MTEQPVTRRLSAIVAADIAYSSVVGADEAGTIAAAEDWAETFNPSVAI